MHRRVTCDLSIVSTVRSTRTGLVGTTKIHTPMQEIDNNSKSADSMEMTFELKALLKQPNVITDCAAGTYRKPYQLAKRKRPKDPYSQPLSAHQVASMNKGVGQWERQRQRRKRNGMEKLDKEEDDEKGILISASRFAEADHKSVSR